MIDPHELLGAFRAISNSLAGSAGRPLHSGWPIGRTDRSGTERRQGRVPDHAHAEAGDIGDLRERLRDVSAAENEHTWRRNNGFDENLELPAALNYGDLAGLSMEARQKLAA